MRETFSAARTWTGVAVALLAAVLACSEREAPSGPLAAKEDGLTQTAPPDAPAVAPPPDVSAPPAGEGLAPPPAPDAASAPPIPREALFPKWKVTPPPPAVAPNALLDEPEPDDSPLVDSRGAKSRVQLEHREEGVGRSGEHQGRVEQTDVTVRVPVSEQVEVKGGVRVDERQPDAREKTEVEPKPAVGVEVKF